MARHPKNQPVHPAKSVVFRRYRRCPHSGRILDAWDYGYKAWPIGS